MYPENHVASRVGLTRLVVRSLRATGKFKRVHARSESSHTAGREKGRICHVWRIRESRARSKIFRARIPRFSARFAVEPQESREEIRNNEDREGTRLERQRQRKREREEGGEEGEKEREIEKGPSRQKQ